MSRIRSRLVSVWSSSSIPAALLSLAISGCFPAPPAVREAKRQAEIEKEADKEPSGSILKKTTQDIGKYDPDAGRELNDGKIRATSMVFYPLEAYGPMVQQIAELQVGQLVTVYQIENNRYPTYEQFMQDIIKANNVQLPVLPGKAQYQYDEANHKLVVVAPESRMAKRKRGRKNEDRPYYWRSNQVVLRV